MRPHEQMVFHVVMAGDEQEFTDALIRILQDAHAGELAAAYAYRGHARSLRQPDEKSEVLRIEEAEWHHRNMVAMLLDVLGARPRRRRELLMGSIGRFFGTLCFVGGWFGPMYAAGRLEATNVGQYESARDIADKLGWDAAVARLEEMTIEEDRHEKWFGDRCRGHWMLPFAVRMFGWQPPPAAYSATRPE